MMIIAMPSCCLLCAVTLNNNDARRRDKNFRTASPDKALAPCWRVPPGAPTRGGPLPVANALPRGIAATGLRQAIAQRETRVLSNTTQALEANGDVPHLPAKAVARDVERTPKEKEARVPQRRRSHHASSSSRVRAKRVASVTSGIHLHATSFPRGHVVLEKSAFSTWSHLGCRPGRSPGYRSGGTLDCPRRRHCR